MTMNEPQRLLEVSPFRGKAAIRVLPALQQLPVEQQRLDLNPNLRRLPNANASLFLHTHQSNERP